MKPARIIVLVIALVAGAIAAFLANRPEQAPPPAPPVAQLETVDVLIANADTQVAPGAVFPSSSFPVTRSSRECEAAM